MRHSLLSLLAALLLVSCGSTDSRTGAECAVSGGCAPICQTLWQQEKDHGGTVYAGSWYCNSASSTVYVLTSREGSYAPYTAGTYSGQLACSFKVTASCSVQEQ
jgi:hypothetical protein